LSPLRCPSLREADIIVGAFVEAVKEALP